MGLERELIRDALGRKKKTRRKAKGIEIKLSRINALRCVFGL